MLVVDASSVVDLLIGNPRGGRVAAQLTDEVAAPDLLDVEVASAMARLVRAKDISADRASHAITRLETLPVFRVRCTLLVRRAWSLRQSLRVSDGFYVACAQLLACPLLTADARLGAAAPRDLTITVIR